MFAKAAVAAGFGLACAVGAPSIAADPVDETARLLTKISQPSFSKRKTTEKRFRFVLPTFVTNCADVSAPMKAGDMMVVAYQTLDKAGLGDQEKLPQLADNLYRLTTDVADLSRTDDVPVRCAQIWSMYLTLREKGREPAEAVTGVYGVVKGLLKLAQ